eukprot:4960680-Pleurochrysis_carterae.AAC.7
MPEHRASTQMPISFEIKQTKQECRHLRAAKHARASGLPSSFCEYVRPKQQFSAPLQRQCANFIPEPPSLTGVTLKVSHAHAQARQTHWIVIPIEPCHHATPAMRLRQTQKDRCAGHQHVKSTTPSAL